MKARAAEAFLRQHVLRSLPGWECRGRLLFRRPVGLILHAVHMNDPRWEPESFHPLRVLVCPLYVNFGVAHLCRNGIIEHTVPRPTQGKTWRIEPDDEAATGRDLVQTILASEAFFSKFDGPQQWLAHIHEIRFQTPYVLEATAAAHILVGDPREALALLDAAAADWDQGAEELFEELAARLRTLSDTLSFPDGRRRAIEMLRETERRMIELWKMEAYVNANRWDGYLVGPSR